MVSNELISKKFFFFFFPANTHTRHTQIQTCWQSLPQHMDKPLKPKSHQDDKPLSVSPQGQEQSVGEEKEINTSKNCKYSVFKFAVYSQQPQHVLSGKKKKKKKNGLPLKHIIHKAYWPLVLNHYQQDRLPAMLLVKPWLTINDG